MNATWWVKIDALRTQLRVGLDPDERAPQPVRVMLHLRGVSAACPSTLADCIDYTPLCRWIAEGWSRTPHVPLLETRVNELLAMAFDLDERVQEVRVGLFKERMGRSWGQVGVERCVLRHEFAAQARHLAGRAIASAPVERSSDECLPA